MSLRALFVAGLAVLWSVSACGGRVTEGTGASTTAGPTTGPGSTVVTGPVSTVGSSVTVGTGGGAGGATACPGGTGSAGRSSSVACRTPFPSNPVVPTSDLISDFEGDAALGIKAFVPGGIWGIDRDGTGNAEMMVEPCGTTGNGLHFKGAGLTRWGADVAAAIVSAAQPVDVSAYCGISFVLLSWRESKGLIFKAQNSYSQPDCGLCDEFVPDRDCYSGYTKSIGPGPQTIAWGDLVQQTWGYRAPGSAAFDPHDLISIAFAFPQNVDFDICLDDVKFVR
jgi:hypothetical protein